MESSSNPVREWIAMETGNGALLVVIPAYNEETSIGVVLESVKRVLPDAKILVINDNSVDATAKVAESGGAIVITHPVNLGYGASIQTGYLFALHGDYNVVLQMDSDGQHVAEEAPKIIEPVLLGEADLVVGSRYGAYNEGYTSPFFRRAGHVFFGAILRLFTGLRITDPTSGFICMNRRVMKLFSGDYFPEDFPDADMLILAHFAGVSITEIPVRMNARENGKSIHEGMRPFYYVAKMLLSIAIILLNRKLFRRLREHDSEAIHCIADDQYRHPRVDHSSDSKREA
jgi:glycosyltransferase involved in cell wall biosynthesis